MKKVSKSMSFRTGWFALAAARVGRRNECRNSVIRSSFRAAAVVSIGWALFQARPMLAAGQSDESFEVVLTEVWTTPGDPGFGRPLGVAQWPDGSVWVGDSRISEVFEVSPDGSRTRTALRDGDGPREVRFATVIVPRPGGGMVVWDSRRVGFFKEDKSLDRYRSRPSARGHVVATPDGGLVVSGYFGDDPEHGKAAHAVHRYDRRLRVQKSWHPVVDHQQWETVRYTSGGPVALTRDGGLLVSDRAPFRITRYADLEGADPRVIVEDESIVSSAELDRAVTYGPGSRRRFTTAWTQSKFVHELPDGNILNVVFVDPEEGGQHSVWVVVAPDGAILARTKVAEDYTVWNATPDGAFLATYWHGASQQHFVAKLKVRVVPANNRVGSG